ncbi:MAG: hypothetical protein PHS82_05740 [Lachnospiraceae bacterium]|nr:hypothetical protein [Lachnospiraceae bacterium]
MVKCSNCGAMFDEHEPKCPYCDTLYFPGAEEEYLEQLDDVKEDVEDLKDYSMEEYKKTVRKESLSSGKIVLIVLLIAAVVSGGLFGLFVYNEHTYNQEAKNKVAWVRENAPELNKMYEAGDFDGLLKYMHELSDEDAIYFWGWNHAEFMLAYYEHENMFDEKKEQDKRINAAVILMEGIYTETMTSTDKKKVAEYQQEAEKFLSEETDMTKEDIKKYYEEEIQG